MRRISYIGFVIGAICMIYGCDLEQTIEVDLPEYESQPLVECYLEPGQGYHLLLSRTAPYFDPVDINDLQGYFLNLLINEATVIVRYGDEEVELVNQAAFNPVTGSFSNYSNEDFIVPYDTMATFELEILLPDSTQIFGSTRILPRIEFDSIVVEFKNPEDSITTARVLTYFSDPPKQENYFRRMLHLDSLSNQGTWEQDFIASDEFNDQSSTVYGTAFEYLVGDTLINSLFHIDKPYFDYLVSLFGAMDANDNPFAPGGQLLSTVYGDANPLGVFTGLTYARDTTVIKR